MGQTSSLRNLPPQLLVPGLQVWATTGSFKFSTRKALRHQTPGTFGLKPDTDCLKDHHWGVILLLSILMSISKTWGAQFLSCFCSKISMLWLAKHINSNIQRLCMSLTLSRSLLWHWCVHPHIACMIHLADRLWSLFLYRLVMHWLKGLGILS